MRSASCCKAARLSDLDLSVSAVASRECMLGIMLDVIENPLGLGADIKVAGGDCNLRSAVSSVTEPQFRLDPLVGLRIDLIEDSLFVFSALNSLAGASESVAENDRFRLEEAIKDAGEPEDCRSLMMAVKGGSRLSSDIESRLVNGCNV